MNLKFIYIFLAFFAVVPLFGQNKIKWTQVDKLSEKVQQGGRKFIVYFYYDGCKWCRYMEDTTLGDDNIAKFINQNYYSFRINAIYSEKISVLDKTYAKIKIDKFDFQELAVDLLDGHMNFPSVVFLDEKFKKIQSFDSYIEVPNFEMILSYFAGDHHKKTMFKRYSNNYCRDNHFNSLVNEKN